MTGDEEAENVQIIMNVTNIECGKDFGTVIQIGGRTVIHRRVSQEEED